MLLDGFLKPRDFFPQSDGIIHVQFPPSFLVLRIDAASLQAKLLCFFLHSFL